MTKVRVSRIALCSNIECPNKSGEGAFALVQIGPGEQIVQGHRGVTLVLCEPCAKAIRGVITDDKP